MYHFEGVLGGCDGFLGHPEPVQYKKVKLDRKDKWLGRPRKNPVIETVND